MDTETVSLFVRVTPEVHDWLAEQAKADRRSMASLTEFIFRQEMRRRSPKHLSPEPPQNIDDLNVSDRIDRLISEAR